MVQHPIFCPCSSGLKWFSKYLIVWVAVLDTNFSSIETLSITYLYEKFIFNTVSFPRLSFHLQLTQSDRMKLKHVESWCWVNNNHYILIKLFFITPGTWLIFNLTDSSCKILQYKYGLNLVRKMQLLLKLLCAPPPKTLILSMCHSQSTALWWI